MQPTNYMGGAESDIGVNTKGGATHMNDLLVPNTCLLCQNLAPVLNGPEQGVSIDHTA